MTTRLQCPDASTLAEAIARRCDKARLHGDSWKACCPAHDDRSPSLSITPSAGRVLLHCFVGCAPESILAALGLTLADLFVSAPPSPNGHRQIVAVYDYLDAQGMLLHQTVRYASKKFKQRRPDPAQPGDYLWNLQGIEPVLYHLPAVLAALARGETIYVVEGERDVETLTRHGLTSTTNPMGAGKWRPSYTETLCGAHVVLLPDNDAAGRQHVAEVMEALRPHVASMKVVVLPDLPAKGDVTDWLQGGHSMADLQREITQTPPEVCTVSRLLTTAEAPTQTPQALAGSVVSADTFLALHLSPRKAYMDWLRERSLSLVYGPAGVGKTMFLLGTAISLATPKPFLKWAAPDEALGTLYIDGEMSLEELQTRVRQLVGDAPPPRLHFLPSELVYERSGRDLTLTAKADRLAIDGMLDAHQLHVLILDNISCLFPGIDESNKRDWEPIAAWLIQLRHRGITVLIGHHAGKNGLQRGTSGREDALDTIVALTRPPGYKPEDGCHFHLRFDKARGIKGPAVEALDVRVEDIDGALLWTCNALEATRTEQVKRMLLESIPVRVIAEEFGVAQTYVYRLKRSMGL